MSEEPESEFLDARPETARQAKVQAASAAADALVDMADEGDSDGDDDDLVFLDAAADSGLDIKVIAPGRKTPEAQPGAQPASAGAPAPADRQSLKKRRKSARHRVSGVHSASSGGHAALAGAQEEWARRARTPAEQTLALTRLHETAQPPIPADPFIGMELGPFRVEKFLRAERGMRVYVGLDVESSQERALMRVFPLKGSYAAEFKALLERGERACRVQSPAMAVCVAAGRAKDCFFTGHELPMGETLAELLASGTSIEEKDVLDIVGQVAGGLKVLHARQLVHGDISLNTIRRERDGVYVLEGAGLGRSRPEFDFLAAGGEVVGCPGYIAPELVDSGEGTAAADLYALGCVAWSLLAGRPPFAGSDQVQVLLDQLNKEVPHLKDVEDAKVSEGTATIVAKLTGYAANVRYASVSDLVADLRAREKGGGIKPFPSNLDSDESAEFGEPKKIDTGTLLWILLLLLNVALAVGVVGSWLKTNQIHLEDPIPGYELPLPGISDGGYGQTQPEQTPKDGQGQPPNEGQAPNH